MFPNIWALLLFQMNDMHVYVSKLNKHIYMAKQVIENCMNSFFSSFQ